MVMSMDWYEDMKEFHKVVMEDEIPKTPCIPPEYVKRLRKNLIKEEIGETLNAMEYNDMVEMADGIVDSIVVLIGTAIMYGIDIRRIWNIIHKTNMAKKGGILREDGKLLKPNGWQSPDIRSELLRQGWEEE